MLNANPDRLNELQATIDALPRIPLANLPTPLERCSQLSAEVGGPDIWVKRDDMTGLAMGGNKTRMFEYVLGQVKADGMDTVVGGAAVQSNYCRQLAAACAKAGLECHLVLRRVRGEKDDEIQGGLLLDLIVGAHVTVVDAPRWSEQGELVRARAAELSSQGKRVFIARVGNESGLGLYAASYAAAAIELIKQAEGLELKIDELWLCSSDTTQAGLALGLKHVQSPIKIVGVPALAEPVMPGWTFEECLSSIGNECAELLGLSTRLDPSELISLTDYVGPGYGLMDDAHREALRLVGRTEGLLLDPVYTCKVMSGLLDHIRTGKIGSDKKIVFLHTGGLPALFAYNDELNLSLETTQ
ncbi:MAG: D-cysteine desulfhydrase family protein [Planctomycetota bacterium]|jgi:1-aminocyclopropane-1-carboxylate deaminase/D-cysteine desulfhydrase-like pyridoxal-dependent ACC family enzyme|nr:D-cysteine desulfhydrase family protein [Planctomycetota bacterium]MDP7135189.1 D-cysteine desulfhydrase family protein [Planctomycetota bacterium]MDP7253036.1 D-cysteine desulfhydrase family protein [Planctomycetota bacterium]